MKMNLSEYLAAFTTRASAAMALVHNPAPDPTRQELVESRLALAVQYVRDVEELTELVSKTARKVVNAEELIRDLSNKPIIPRGEPDRRASGRSFRLLLHGLIAISEGHKVRIVAMNSDLAKDMARRLEKMAWELNIPTVSHSHFVGYGSPESPRTGFRGVILVDHTVCGGGGRLEIGEQPPPFTPKVVE